MTFLPPDLAQILALSQHLRNQGRKCLLVISEASYVCWQRWYAAVHCWHSGLMQYLADKTVNCFLSFHFYRKSLQAAALAAAAVQSVMTTAITDCKI